MKFKLKTIVLSIACVASSSAFANTMENRIAALETELNQLKELRAADAKAAEAKNTQIATQFTKQPSITLSDTNLKFYGIVRMDGAVDFKDTASNQFVQNQTPDVNKSSAGNRSAVTLTATRLGMDISKVVKDTDVKAKIEMDFWDGAEGNGKLRIRHAYVDFNNWLLGQTSSGMANIETNTESVDYTLFMGYSWTRTPQVRYNFNLAPQHNLKIAAEYVDSRSSELPALTAKYVFNQSNVTAVAQGFVHEKRATVTVNGDEKDLDKLAWGIGAGLKFKPTDQSSIQGHFYHVEGDEKFVSYTAQNAGILNGYPSKGDFSVNANQNDLDQNKVNTYVLGYSHKLSDQWRTNLVASLLDFDDSTAYAKNNTAANKRVSDLAANLFYTPVPSVDVGLEYHQGKREQFDGKEFDVSRLNFVTAYKF
ncbi:DcaP family trimeric outer membrane transporter [Acinetobacter towneri]|uniref:Porin n=1 Tax=Acinetobacter towneri TaxID=202956 RepID=A0AAP9KJC8_9GAMM|nr:MULTISPECIES: DcaP family trimeric outer membrane transporter [Acinetobacter]QGM27300.1 porin [Acinetobacter towneri]